MIARWSDYTFFKKSEFDCKHTGHNLMQQDFMLMLEGLRAAYRKPMIITSGYRSPKHPTELRKGHTTGEHTTGLAADIAISAVNRYNFVALAIEHGFTRIGIADKFVHLGISNSHPHPRIWTY